MGAMRPILLVLPLAVACRTAGPRVPASIAAADIQRHVDHLASDELEGRWSRGPQAHLAAAYVADAFARSGLVPLGDAGGWTQTVDPDLSPNVVAGRLGSGPGIVIVGAHYDHLEPRAEGPDRIFNGADDNASGTAALLEVAEAIGAREPAPAATWVFVAFTAEEIGLLGSRFFVEHPPFDLGRVRAVFNLDMVSRGEEDLIFAEGSPDPDLRAAVRRANAATGLRIRWDEHPEWIPASDHLPFLQAGLPTLYFGVEDHPDYHRVSDPRRSHPAGPGRAGGGPGLPGGSRAHRGVGAQASRGRAAEPPVKLLVASHALEPGQGRAHRRRPLDRQGPVQDGQAVVEGAEASRRPGLGRQRSVGRPEGRPLARVQEGPAQGQVQRRLPQVQVAPVDDAADPPVPVHQQVPGIEVPVHRSVVARGPARRQTALGQVRQPRGIRHPAAAFRRRGA